MTKKTDSPIYPVNEPNRNRATVTDQFDLQYKPNHGKRRLIRFTPNPDGDGFVRITALWEGCHWRVTGEEIVTDVQLRGQPVSENSDTGDAYELDDS